MLDRRQSPRFKTYKAAQVVFNGRWSTLDCLVRNLSGQGACLEIPSTVDIPVTFSMMSKQEKTEQTCRLVWRTKHHVGVVFKRAA
jgi:hypothetical protein